MIVVIPLLLLLPGLAAWLAFGRDLRGKLTVTEIAFLVVLTGALVISWLALLLAELGRFSLPLLAAITATGSILLAGRAVWRHGLFNPFQYSDLPLLDLLALPLLLFPLLILPKPFEYLAGGRDHGVYVNTGIHIARSGGILIEDPELAALPAESVPLLTQPGVSAKPSLMPGPWSEGQRLVGLTIRDASAGTILPHGFHLYPVWIALFHAAGGTISALAATPLLALLGTWSIYLYGARLLGRRPALLGLGMLVLNVSQIYFYRYPSAEILLRFYFWAGLLAFLLMQRTGSRFLAVVSAVAIGLLHPTKLDTVFVPVVLALFFVYAWFSGRFRRVYWYFIVPYLLLLLHAGVHALFLATIYSLDQATRVLLPDFLAERVVRAAAGHPYPTAIADRLLRQNLDLVLGSVILVALFLLVARNRARFGRYIRRVEHWGRAGTALLATGLGLLALYATLVYSLWPLPRLSGSADAFGLITLYLSPLGLLLGFAGLLPVVSTGTTAANKEQEEVTFAWLLILGGSVPLLLLGSGTYPDQFWAIRRFVPILIPAFLLFGAYAIWRLLPTVREEWPSLFLPVGVALALVFLFWKDSQPLVGVVEYERLVAEVEELAAKIPDDAVLLFERSNEATHVALPLWLLFDQTVFTVEESALADPALVPAVSNWRTQGREVYWVDTDGQGPTWAAGLDADYVATDIIPAPLLEMPPNSIPDKLGLVISTLDLFQLTGDPPAEASIELVTIATGREPADSLLEGVFPIEQAPGLSPRRWGSGRVTMQVPLPDHPQRVLLMMGNGRSVDAPTPVVEVWLNDEKLGSIPVAESSGLYSLPVPQQTIPTGGPARLELTVEPWIPAAAGTGTDRRELGVYLDWVKFVLMEAREATTGGGKIGAQAGADCCVSYP